MSPSVVALTVIFAIVVLGAGIGFYAGARHKMDLEQWTVAGRGFGLLLVWLLMAGEIYTTFAFLGASGWAYSRGGPTLYILGYLTLAYVVSFYILPQVWEVGRKHALQTQSDFFQRRYGSKYLAAFVSLVGVVFMIPYLQLQLTGLGIIVEVASFEGIGRTPAMIVAFALVAGFVFASGVRAVAWVSVLKDILLLGAAFAIGISVPYHYFGGIGPMFAALVKIKPQHLTMPGSTPNLGHSWYISTVLLTSFGFYMWPHTFGSTYTAKSGNTLRRNAVVMSLYGITLPLIFFRGLRRHPGGARIEEWRPVAADRGAQDISRVVSGADRRGGRADGDGAGGHSDPDRGHLVREESLPPNFRAADDGRAGCPAGQDHGAGDHGGRAVLRDLQFDDFGRVAAFGIRRRDAILPRGGARAVLAACDHIRHIRGHGGGRGYGGVADADQARSLSRAERRVLRVVPEFCGDGDREFVHAGESCEF